MTEKEIYYYYFILQSEFLELVSTLLPHSHLTNLSTHAVYAHSVYRPDLGFQHSHSSSFCPFYILWGNVKILK